MPNEAEQKLSEKVERRENNQYESDQVKRPANTVSVISGGGSHGDVGQRYVSRRTSFDCTFKAWYCTQISAQPKTTFFTKKKCLKLNLLVICSGILCIGVLPQRHC